MNDFISRQAVLDILTSLIDKIKEAPDINVGKCQKCQYSETSNEIDFWCRNWEACVDADGYCYEWAKKVKE